MVQDVWQKQTQITFRGIHFQIRSNRNSYKFLIISEFQKQKETKHENQESQQQQTVNHTPQNFLYWN